MPALGNYVWFLPQESETEAEGFEGDRTPDSGVVRPEAGACRILERRKLELVGGGFRALSKLEVQLNPLRSSIGKEV